MLSLNRIPGEGGGGREEREDRGREKNIEGVGGILKYLGMRTQLNRVEFLPQTRIF